MGCSVARTIGRERLPGSQVCPNQQRIDYTCGHSRVRQPLVSARGYLRQRECRAAEHMSEAGDFFNVCGRISAHTIGIAAVYGVNLAATDVLAIGAGNARCRATALSV